MDFYFGICERVPESFHKIHIFFEYDIILHKKGTRNSIRKWKWGCCIARCSLSLSLHRRMCERGFTGVCWARVCGAAMTLQNEEHKHENEISYLFCSCGVAWLSLCVCAPPKLRLVFLFCVFLVAEIRPSLYHIASPVCIQTCVRVCVSRFTALCWISGCPSNHNAFGLFVYCLNGCLYKEYFRVCACALSFIPRHQSIESRM